MKLYTEEQVRHAIKMARSSYNIFITPFMYHQDEVIEHLTPIELPSDEEVEQYLQSFPYTKHLDDGQYNDGKIVGAELAIQWMRDKIQGGNNEQQ